MTKNNIITYAIILAVIVGIGLVGLKWHNDNVEARVREAVAEDQGKIKELVIQDSINKIERKVLRFTLDSALSKLNQNDTVIIYNTHEKTIDRIAELGIDSSIALLAKNICSSKNRHR